MVRSKAWRGGYWKRNSASFAAANADKTSSVGSGGGHQTDEAATAGSSARLGRGRLGARHPKHRRTQMAQSSSDLTAAGDGEEDGSEEGGADEYPGICRNAEHENGDGGAPLTLRSAEGDLFEADMTSLCEFSPLIRQLVDDQGPEEELPLPSVSTR